MSGQCSMGAGNRTPHHPHVEAGEVKASPGDLYLVSTMHAIVSFWVMLAERGLDLGVTTRRVRWIPCSSGLRNGYGG